MSAVSALLHDATMSDDPKPVEKVEAVYDERLMAGGVTYQPVDTDAIRFMQESEEVLAALQGRLNGVVDSPAGYIAALPKVVKRRIRALKNIQLEAINLEAEFYRDVHSLECKYHFHQVLLYNQRSEVVLGLREPTDTECDFPLDDLAEGLEKTSIGDPASPPPPPPPPAGMDEYTKGIPDFWLTVFKNVDLLAEMIQEHDEPILRHLTDIRIEFHEKDPMGFSLYFHFSSNEYFGNLVLGKQYIMRCAPYRSEPFTFEGPEIIKSTGCVIHWFDGKNVTLKTMTQTQKHKTNGTMRIVTKTVQTDSFFNFFNPPPVPNVPVAEMDEGLRNLLTADYEIGHYIRERIVPRAVLYYTGEALDEDDYDEEEEEEEEEEDKDSSESADEE